MGKLFVVDIETGKTKSIIKIDSNQISRPFILNKNLFLIKEDAIIKLDQMILKFLEKIGRKKVVLDRQKMVII